MRNKSYTYLSNGFDSIPKDIIKYNFDTSYYWLDNIDTRVCLYDEYQSMEPSLKEAIDKLVIVSNFEVFSTHAYMQRMKKDAKNKIYKSIKAFNDIIMLLVLITL